MRELVTAVAAALSAAGLNVTEKFPAGEARRLRQPVVAVSVKALHGEGGGLADYLGETEQGASRYGKRFTAELLCRVAVPVGMRAPAAAEPVCAALLGGVPGITVRTIAVGEPLFDAVADCFTLDVTATCAVYLYAEQDADDAAFLDFRLECESN